MCKHQLPKLKTATLPAANTKLAEVKLHDKGLDFVSCGVDRSCPTSVTTHQGQGVRLDQYQSSIGEKTSNRRRQKNLENPTLASKSSQHSSSTFDHSNVDTDHEFDWYDLDAIGELGSGNQAEDHAIIISHDFNAGLIFTTERQILRKEVEVNIVNTSATKKDKIGQMFFWVNGDNNRFTETSDDREFRKRLEELELEVKSDLSPVPPPLLQMSPSFSSSSCSSSSHDDDATEHNESNDKGNFFTKLAFRRCESSMNGKEECC